MKFSYFFIPMVLVLIVPIVFILTGYTWTTADLLNYPFLKYFTLTGGGILGMVVSVVLALIIMFYYRHNKTLAISIAIYCFLAVAGGGILKHVMKNYFEEPRPFVFQMAKTIYGAEDPAYFRNLQLTYTNLNALAGLSSPAATDNSSADATNSDNTTNTANTTDNNPATTDNSNSSDNANSTNTNNKDVFNCHQCRNPEEIASFYYTLNQDQRKFFIKYYESRFMVDSSSAAKEELKSYAEIEHYSLPSGHALLGATWTMIFFVLAFNARLWSFWAITWVVGLWGIGLEASRVLLGVHYPHDVLFSAIIASGGVWFTFWITLVIYGILYTVLNKWLKVFPLHELPANFIIHKKEQVVPPTTKA